ncbi:transporter associated domain-containing protein, partial [Francisella tularensis]|uniref:transporter associated domain-containing protein n=1 Tax=Francisella tularensis TaxID=263 RepID=UPI002381D09E
NIVKMTDDKFIVDATTTKEDFNEYCATSLDDNSDYDTLAGMIIQTLECLRQKGDSIVVDGLTCTVQEADNRKIIKM